MKHFIYFLLMVFCFSNSFAQISTDRQVIGSTGSLTNTGAIIASSTVGETIIPTFSQSTLVVTQGFQQPDSITVTGITAMETHGITITAYPNPATSHVILDFTISQSMDIGIDIYNEAGQLMQKHLQNIIQNKRKQELSFGDFAAGNYFIVVKSADGKLYKLFKVQKTK